MPRQLDSKVFISKGLTDREIGDKIKSPLRRSIAFFLLIFMWSLTTDNVVLVGKCLDISTQAIRSRFVVDEMGYNGFGIRVAVLDTGIDATHPDFLGKTIVWRDFVNNIEVPYDDHGHGTHCAGILCGTGLASSGVYRGVAPGVTTLIIGKMCDNLGETTEQWFTDSLRWAVDVARAQVISLSQGIQRRWYNEPYCNGQCSICQMVDYCVRRGAVVVVGAGDEGIPKAWDRTNPNAVTDDGYRSLRCPATAFEAITVGATRDKNTKSINDDEFAFVSRAEYPPFGWASSRGPTADDRVKPDVMAPGVRIWSPDPVGNAGYSAGDYCNFEGASAATPLVAGVAALILQAHPKWTPAMVKYAIKVTANLNDLLQSLTENDRGKGIVDAARAISLPATEIPPDQADSKYEDHWGNSDAIAYLNGTFRIWAAGTIAGDARAEARLTKAFTPNHDMPNTTFFFGFHDIGYMESDLGYATFYATLKLWQGNTTLASTEEKIHQVDWGHAYDANCFHTIQLIYQNKLLAGQQYKLEYGFWTFAHVAWSNFYDVKPSAGVTALHLSAIDTIGIGNPSLEERIFFGSVYEAAYWYTPGPYSATNNSGWRNVRGDLGGPINYIPTWGAFDGKVDAYDLALFRDAYNKDKYSHKYYWYADFNGDEQIDAFDLAIFGESQKNDKRYYLDGLYSWFATGTRTGGDYIISQWLCDHDVNVMKGQQINFTFWYKPQTLTQNNASAEIHYVLDNGANQTINGTPVCPTQITWYNPYVVASIPANTIAIKIIIHGGPNFKAWVDKTSITIT